MKKRMKQAVSMILTAALSLSLLVGCKNDGNNSAVSNEDDSVKLWYAYNTENLMKDLEYPELMAQRDSTVRMYCVRNDVETAQLMITPSVNVASFDFVMGDLKNENGDVLASSNISMYTPWYVEVVESYIADALSGIRTTWGLAP